MCHSKSAIGFVLAFALAGVVVGQVPAPFAEHHAVSGPGTMTWGVNGVGDVNGDGHSDFLVSYDAPIDLVRVYSGANGSVLQNLGAPSPGIWGFDADGLGDIDADGFDDFIVSSNNGDIVVVSGGPGTITYSYSGASGGWGPSSFAGWAVAGLGDVDGDGTPDFGASTFATAAGPGFVGFTVYSGATGAIIRTHTAGNLLDTPLAIDGIGDLEGDGFGDYVCSFTNDIVHVYSGFNGVLLHDIPPPIGSGASEWGANAAGAGDVNSDGVPDILVGGRFVNDAFAFSGTDGSLLRHFAPSAATGTIMSSNGAGDVNGDGFDDVIIGFQSSGTIHVMSGADGSSLLTVTGSGNLGFRVDAAGDVDGNGTSDVIASIVNGPGARIFGMVAADYPGSQEDLVLRSGVGLTLTTFHEKEASAGDLLAISLQSPGSSLLSHPPVLVGQLQSAGSVGPSPAGFPELHIDINRPIATIFDGRFGVFGPVGLPAAGLNIAVPVPSGLAGSSLTLQGFSLTSSAANSFFAATNAHEIVFL